MSDYVKRQTEERARAWEQAKALLDSAAAENRDLTAEESESYAKINADLDARAQVITKMLADEARENEIRSAIAGRPEARPDEARTEGDLNKALRSFLSGESREYSMPLEVRALGKSTAGAGGATVDTSFSGRLWEHLIETAQLAGIATHWNTSKGENLEVPVTTSHGTGALTAEAAAISASDPAFAKRTLGAYKYATLVQVPRELLDDTAVDLEGYIARQAGRGVGNAFGAHLVTGTGTSQPAGIMTTASAGVTGGTAVAGAFTADNLIDLYFSVIAPYRNSGSAGWLMKDATMANVRKLKDTTNQYLWQPSLVLGAPDMLLGKPVYTDPNVAAVGLSAKSVLFGDLSAYIVRTAGGVRFESSTEYAFNTDLVTFRAVVRGDGILADQTGSVKAFSGGAT